MRALVYFIYKLPPWLYALAFIVLTTTVAVLGSMPSAAAQVPSPVPQFDKVLHFTLFSILSSLLWMSRTQPTRRFVWLAIVLLGAADEYHQSFLSFRSCDIYDLLTDTLAASATVAVWGYIHQYAIRVGAGRCVPAPATR